MIYASDEYVRALAQAFGLDVKDLTSKTSAAASAANSALSDASSALDNSIAAKDAAEAISPNVRKITTDAARPPLPTDDEAQGYAVGSRWQYDGQEWVRTVVGWVRSQIGEYSSRAEAEAAHVPAPAQVITVDGLRFRRDAAGDAMTTGDGARWSPDGEWTDAHFTYSGMTIAERTAALQAWCGPKAPPKIILRGAHMIAGTLDLTASTVSEVIGEPTGFIVQTADAPIWQLLGTRADAVTHTITTSVAVGSRAVTMANPSAFAVGDWVMLRCNNLTPNVTAGSRVGMLRKITEIGADRIYLDAAVYRVMDNNPTLYKVSLGRKILFTGGRYESVNQQNKRPLFWIFLSFAPSFRSVRYGNTGGAGITLVNCVGGTWEDCHAYNLRNDAPNGHYGYGVGLAGACRGFQLVSGMIERARHGITTTTANTIDIPLDLRSLMEQRGEPESCVYGPVYCFDTTEAAFDTHEQGHNIRIVPNAHGCFSGVNIRCNDAFVDGGRISDCRRMAIRVTNPASNPSAISTQKITITGTVIDGVAQDGAGGAESYGIYVMRPGAEVLIQNVRLSGYRGTGIHAVDGAKLIITSGLVDGGGEAGTTGIRLDGGGSMVRGAIVRGNATDISQATGTENDITLSSASWMGVMEAGAVTSTAVNTMQTLRSVDLPNDQLDMRLDTVRVKAAGNITGTGGGKDFVLRLGTSDLSFPSYGGEGPWAIEATIISTGPTAVRMIATLTTASGPATVVQSHNIGAARPWSAAVRVRINNTADVVTQTLMAVLP